MRSDEKKTVWNRCTVKLVNKTRGSIKYHCTLSVNKQWGDWPCAVSCVWALSSQSTESITFLKRDMHWQTDRERYSHSFCRNGLMIGRNVMPYLCSSHQLTGQWQEAVHDWRQEQPVKGLWVFTSVHTNTAGTGQTDRCAGIRWLFYMNQSLL